MAGWQGLPSSDRTMQRALLLIGWKVVLQKVTPKRIQIVYVHVHVYVTVTRDDNNYNVVSRLDLSEKGRFTLYMYL